MLIATQAIFGCSLENGEEQVGTVRDLFFDGQTWIVRHVVVDTGSWLSGRRVLLPPSVVEQKDWPNRRLWVPLTKKQARECPPVETHLPVSRRKEAEHVQYLVWNPAGAIVEAPVATASGRSNDDAQADRDLRSANELTGVTVLTGYQIEAVDGYFGHVAELIVDDEAGEPGMWEIRYLIVDTQKWLPGKKVLVASRWAESIDWGTQLVRVGLSRETIKNSPEYDADVPVNRRYEEVLYDYYGKPRYWIAHESTTSDVTGERPSLGDSPESS